MHCIKSFFSRAKASCLYIADGDLYYILRLDKHFEKVVSGFLVRVSCHRKVFSVKRCLVLYCSTSAHHR
jgi:hypothetical protein